MGTTRDEANQAHGHAQGRAPDGALAFAALQRELELGLAEALGGFELLDRKLMPFAVDGPPWALGEASEGPASGPPGATTADDISFKGVNLVGVDPSGRLVLVVWLEPTEYADALARALDLVAYATDQRRYLERHFDRTLAADGPLAVLVGARLPAELVRRARIVGPARVRLLEARELRSERGVSTWFAAPDADSPAQGSGGPRSFIAVLDAALAERAEGLVARLARLDAELIVARTLDGLEWLWRGRSVCNVVPRAGRLEGRVDALERVEVRPIVDGPSTEAFLDAALARFLALDAEVRGSAAVGPLA